MLFHCTVQIPGDTGHEIIHNFFDIASMDRKRSTPESARRSVRASINVNKRKVAEGKTIAASGEAQTVFLIQAAVCSAMEKCARSGGNNLEVFHTMYGGRITVAFLNPVIRMVLNYVEGMAHVAIVATSKEGALSTFLNLYRKNTPIRPLMISNMSELTAERAEELGLGILL